MSFVISYSKNIFLQIHYSFFSLLQDVYEKYISLPYIYSLVKKILLVLGALTIIAFVGYLLVSKYLDYSAELLNGESRDFVNNTVPVIFENWDYDELEKVTSYEFKDVTNEKDLKEQFQFSREKLGRMKLYTGSQGKVRFVFDYFHYYTIAEFSGIAEFENDKALILTTLVKRDDRWQLLGFKVQSDSLNPYQHK